jgi:uncharacterized protein with HEPN domain
LPSDKPWQRLEDIIENAERIGLYAEGMTFEAFCTDLKTQDAIERCLQRITEAGLKLGDKDWNTWIGHPPFHALRGLGNRLRHGYDGIDLARIWEMVAEAPALIDACKRALARFDR